MSAPDVILSSLLGLAHSLYARGLYEDAWLLYWCVHWFDLRNRARTAPAARQRRRANKNPRQKPFILEADPVGRFLISRWGPNAEVFVQTLHLAEKLRAAPRGGQSAALRDLVFFCDENPPPFK